MLIYIGSFWPFGVAVNEYADSSAKIAATSVDRQVLARAIPHKFGWNSKSCGQQRIALILVIPQTIREVKSAILIQEK